MDKIPLSIGEEMQSQVPGLVRDYFGAEAARDSHPIIVQTFVPGTGWHSYPGRKYVSLSWLRKLKQREGVTHVLLKCGERYADFGIDEIIRYANRPLLGGRVI